MAPPRNLGTSISQCPSASSHLMMLGIAVAGVAVLLDALDPFLLREFRGGLEREGVHAGDSYYRADVSSIGAR